MSEEPEPRRGKRANVALALASVSLALSLISCGVLALTADLDLLSVQSPPEPASASEVEAIAHVTFPPGTVFLSAARTGGLETSLSAKFRMPREALDTFIADGDFTAGLAPGLRAVTGDHNVGGGDTWHPEDATKVSGLDEETPGPDDTFRSLLVDLDAEDVVTVYLYASRG